MASGIYEAPMLYNGVGSPQSIYSQSTTKHHRVGTKGVLPDGRVFYYGRNGIIEAITPGQGVMPELLGTPADMINMVQTDDPGIGATQLEVTAGSTHALQAGDTATDPEYEGGYLIVADDTGEGFTYPIVGHDDIAVTATGTVFLGAPIVKAFGASTTVTIQKNPWADIQVTDAAQAHMMCGVVPTDVAIGVLTAPVYCWVQTWGVCGAIANAATAVGAALTSGTAAGRVEIAAATDQNIGVNLALGIDTETGPIFLMIAP